MAIPAHDDSQQRSELRIAFLKHLPKRLEQLARRGRRACAEGWDINALSVLHDDVQRMAGVAGRYGEVEISQQLQALDGVLAAELEAERLPEDSVNLRILDLLDALAPSTAPAAGHVAAVDGGSLQRPAVQSTRAEIAPSHYWRRWADDSEPLLAAGSRPEATASTPAAAPVGIDFDASKLELVAPDHPAMSVTAALGSARTGNSPRVAPPARMAPITRVPAPAPAPAATAKPSARLYHLTDADELSLELDQKLETLGYELELLETADELKEVLTALAPDLVMVDATFLGDLESIGAAIRVNRERSGARLPLLALAAEDTVPVRLTARRASADALMIAPRSAAEVIARIQELLESGNEATYRVLIVEDDRSQALFAESILRNAGMEARVVSNAFEVLNAMDAFKPDLVLMDLYMPECDGTELTALIREREEYLHTPIVFLSGESDVDKHYEALDAGGDDFLSKPIRPKHLISAVSNRVRRARAMTRRVGVKDPRDTVTGLYARSYALDRINELLGADDVRARPGGVLFFDLDGIAALRERLGLSALEQLLSDVGTLLARELGAPDFASRYGDGSFVVVCPDRPDGSLDTLAVEVRRVLSTHSFTVNELSLRMRLSVGICAFRHGFADAASLLNTAERTSREARGADRGVLRFEPKQRVENDRDSALVALIREATERDGFELLYQPIVAVQGSDESRFQTLLRLRDDSGKLHTAAEILPLATRADLMVDVDRWAMSQALRTIEHRRADGTSLHLFVNQSALALASAGHAEWILTQLRARGLRGDELTIELTLDDIEDRLEQAAGFCEALMSTGVGFCLSRYEAGAVGDSVLDQLPVSCIKLTPKYLMALNMPGTREDLKRIVDSAHKRGLQVIAQRVEDAQSAATLWMSGIDYIQGNLVQQAGHDLNFDFHAAVL